MVHRNERCPRAERQRSEVSGTTEPIAAMAVIDALLVAMFFLFRSLPWSRP